MTDMQSDEPIGGHDVPESAQLALEYLVWILEKAGWKFKNGKTALYWHIIYVVMNHKAAEEPK